MDVWWIDYPRMLGSANPTTADLEELRRQGFEIIISLLREEDQLPNYDLAKTRAIGFARHSIPVKDFHPPTVDQLMEFADPVDRAAKTRIVVHCQGGMGRTGTFGAAYLIMKGSPVNEAITKIRQARVHAIETREQEAILEEFAERYSGRRG
jgi:atypical dual specificity phosphatase